MPSRNVIKHYSEDSYYHVYNRGVEKRIIFIDEQDHRLFLSILKRHLGAERQKDLNRRAYENYSDRLELLAFCLMPNHFHLMFYIVSDPTAITELIRKVSGAYTNYFNKKYKRVGHLFQGVYKASHITDDSYLQHISRYIHLNPCDYKQYPFSSYRFYTGEFTADWLKPGKVLAIFNDNAKDYARFVSDYEEQKEMLEDLKPMLADS